MIILPKLEVTLLIIVTAHVHVVFRLTRIPWLTLIVLFLLTVRTVHLWFSLILLTFSEVNTSFYDCSCVLSFHFRLRLVLASSTPRPYLTARLLRAHTIEILKSTVMSLG